MAEYAKHPDWAENPFLTGQWKGNDTKIGTWEDEAGKKIIKGFNGPKATNIGGTHYNRFKIQPIEFIERNNLSFAEGCIIKRICRYKEKDGEQDLRKAISEIEYLINLHYGNK